MKAARRLFVAALFAAIVAIPAARSTASGPAVVTCVFDQTTGRSTLTVTHDGAFVLELTHPGRCAPTKAPAPTTVSRPIGLVCEKTENGTRLQVIRTTASGTQIPLADVTYPGRAPAACTTGS